MMNVESKFDNVGKLMAYEPDIDPEVTTQVGQEILENRLDPGTWATALSSSQGKRQEALAAYARLRIQQISSRRRNQHKKWKSFDSRRMATCFGVKTVQDLIERSNPSKQLNYLKPQLSVVTLFIFGIGSAGGVGALSRLLGEYLPTSLAPAVPAVAIVVGLVAVAIALTLWFTLPKRWIMLGWNTGLTFACSVACFGSLMGGVKLIAQPVPQTSEVAPKQAVALLVAPATSVNQGSGQALAVSSP